MAKKEKRKPEQAKKVKRAAEPLFWNKLNPFLQKNYIVFCFIILLSILYFIKPLFTNNAMPTSEGGTASYATGFSNPLAEKDQWDVYLGGMPSSSAVEEYTKNIIRNPLMAIFSENHVVAIYLILLTSLAGIGMFIFLTSLSLNRITALIFSVSYMFIPVSLSLIHVGHHSKIGVITLLPLIFAALEKGMQSGKVKYFVYLGGAIAINIGTGHLQMAYFGMWMAGFYFLYRIIDLYLNKEQAKALISRTLLFCAAVLIALGITFRAYAPPYLHTSTESKRAQTEVSGVTQEQYAATWSMHSEEIASYGVPEFVHFNQYYWGRNPFKINSEYFGMIPVLFGIIGLAFLRKRRILIFSLLTTLFFTLFSMGADTPVHAIISNIFPGVKHLRAPSLIAFLTAFSMYIMGAYTFDLLFFRKEKNVSQKRVFTILGGTGLVAVLFLTISKPMLSLWTKVIYNEIIPQRLPVMNNNIPFMQKGIMIFLLFLIISFAAYHFRDKLKNTPVLLAVIFVPITLIDTWRIDKQFFTTVTPEIMARYEKQETDVPVYENIKNDKTGRFRVWPHHALNNQRFSYKGVTMVTGFHDFTLKRYDKILPYIRNPQRPNITVLSLLNAKYFVINSSVQVPNFQKVFEHQGLAAYINPYALPWYYIVHDVYKANSEDEAFNTVLAPQFALQRKAIVEADPSSFFTPDTTAGKPDDVRELSYKAGEIELEVVTEKPGLVVISENYHPNWKAWIDGTPAKIYHANYLWQGVYVEKGTHTIRMKFELPVIKYSRMVSGTFLLGFFVFLGITLFRERKEE